MKIEEVKEEVARIAAMDDDEGQHSAEDDLYERFVRYCAEGHNQFHIGKLAKEILKTKDLKFARWCA